MRDYTSPAQLVGVTTAHHGTLLDKDGLDPAEALFRAETDGLDDRAVDFESALELLQPQVVLECIPQNIRSGEPSLGMLRTAIDRGVHVITANKAPVALAYRDLRSRATERGVQMRFESTILDGLPIFRWVAESPDLAPVWVRGILNATSSMVLESVQLGGSRARGLARAQARGIAEADSVLDLDGWDAAAKAALLGNVWMNGALRVVDVVRAGSDDIKDKELVERAELNESVRLVVEIARDAAGNVKAKVGPVALEPGDPLHGLPGSRGAIQIRTADGRGFCLRQDASGLDDAAAGMMMDLEAIVSGRPQP